MYKRQGYAYAELGLVYFKLAHIREARALWQQGIMLTSGSVQPLTELLQHMSFYVTLDGENRVIPNLCSMATLTATKDVDLAYSYLERAYILEPCLLYTSIPCINYRELVAQGVVA